MAGVDLETGEGIGEVNHQEAEAWTSGPLRLADDAGLAPLGVGRDAEPLLLEWPAHGRRALLVLGGGPAHRAARLFRALPADDESPARWDAGVPVAGADGLRLACPLPTGQPGRFELVALAPEGLVVLPLSGRDDAPEFGPRRHLGLGPDLGLGTGRVAQMVATDWDGDGLHDLLVGFDALDGYAPDGPDVPPAQQVGFNQRGGHPGYDRNGRWRGQPARGRVVWLRNSGQPGDPRFEPAEPIESDDGPLEVSTHPAALVVAWGASRARELLLADDGGQVRLFGNFGGQLPPVLMAPRPIVAAGSPLTLPAERTVLVAADLDGDRKAELLFGTADGRVFAIHSGPVRDEATAPEPLRTEDRTLWLGGGAVVAAADLDADGQVDLVAGDAAGRLHLATRRADRRFALPVAIEAGGLPYRLDPGTDGRLNGPAAPPLGFAAPTLADWHGSGRPDLLVGGAGGEVLYLRNNGAANAPRFDRPVVLRREGGPLITPPRVRPAAVDWEGKGQLDLLSLDLQGFLCVYPRSGPAEVGPPLPLVDRLGRAIRLDGSFGLAGRCALWAGPWLGPDRLDILVGLPRDARFVLPALTGLATASIEALPTVLLLENTGRNVLVPRPIYRKDGRPLVLGSEGCSPCGVDWSGDGGEPDLLVGADDGHVHVFRRDDLTW